MSKAKRTGKIFIDYLRNDYTATAIADYSVRAWPGLPVALPLEWKELKRLKTADPFTMEDALNRLKDKTTDSFLGPRRPDDSSALKMLGWEAGIPTQALS